MTSVRTTDRAAAALLAAALGFVILPGAAQAQDKRVKIRNFTGATIVEFHSRPVGTKSWTPNYSAKDHVSSGGSVTLNFAQNPWLSI